MSMSHPLPSLSILGYINQISAYLITKFKQHISQQAETLGPIPPPLEFSTQLVCDCELLVDKLVLAYQNPVTLPWDADRYSSRLGPKPTGFNAKKEAAMISRYPLISNPPRKVDIPTTIRDQHGRILCWYLPDALTPTRQSIIASTMKHMEGPLRQSMLPGRKKNWRSDAQLFLNAENCVWITPGTVELSPAWFQQGHDINSEPVVVSSALNNLHADAGGRAWLNAANESLALISATLSITHPELYKCGLETLLRLAKEPSLFHVLSQWPSVFNGMSVIGNRETPAHRDNNSRAEWYDILATVGPYDEAILELPNIGLEFQYNSGTLVHLGGRILRHGVHRIKGERVCLAFYMRDNVHERVGVQAASWMTGNCIDRLGEKDQTHV